MLHSIQPKVFIAADMLHGMARCPQCGTERSLSEGAVGLLHYSYEGKVKQSLIWVCQPLCILGFENSQFMGQA